MFVFSFRANKPKLIVGLVLLLIISVSLSVIFLNKDISVKKGQDISAKAADSAQRIAFLSQFGWEINEEPIEVTEVIIPSEFNDTYTEYNNLQKEQSMDLEPYKGKRVKKWVYEVKNYPGYPSENGSLRATLLIYDGLVIGGDVSNISLDGFVRGFDFPDSETTSVQS